MSSLKKNIEIEIIDIIKSLFDEDPPEIKPDMPLIGSSSPLDSMKLVQLCILLEDRATELKFNFDWTSDSVMSRSRSIFRSVQSLIDEFWNQMESQKT